jgi:hypothetical protein
MNTFGWLDTFYKDGLWISPEALTASPTSMCEDEELTESEGSNSCSSKSSHEQSSRTPSHSSAGTYSDSEISEKGTVDLRMPVFVKKFKNHQLFLWARLRTVPPKRDNEKGDSQCIATTKDARKVVGAIDVLQDNQGYLRKNCTWENCAWIVDSYAKGVLSCEFFHEALMGIAVRESLSDIPVFNRAFLQFADLEKKQLHFSSVGGKLKNGNELDSIIHKLNVEEMQSVIFQVLVSICIAQKRIKLKHHDLHLGNVMVTPRKQPGSWVVKTAAGTFTVPLLGYDATIIDFGLSSCVSIHGAGKDTNFQLSRLDSDLLCMGDSGTSSASRPSEIGKSWGVWDPDLEGDTGYDFCMFVESIVDTIVQERPLNMEKLTFLSELQKFSMTRCTDRNRPESKSLVDWAAVFKKFLVRGDLD